ncbi:MAG: SDR family oxidoreductase [Planctomycetes bacterium]|nr:SDR family oxidoreductase [Planctomycetota bacterium]
MPHGPNCGTKPVALVTGGALRVGRAICVELGRAGCDLILTYRSSKDEARALADELRSMGVSAVSEPLDLDHLDGVRSFGEQLAANIPRLDVLVHNASVYAPSPLETLNVEAVLRNYRVNAAAPLLLTRALTGHLSKSPLPGGGAVVAMSDMHVLGRPRRDFSAYAMSKAALTEMVRSLAIDLAPKVRVNAVAPGVVAFPEAGHESDPEMQARYLQRVPLRRSGTPEDAARAVRYLALEATYTTGEVLRLDGGRWLAN